MAARLSTTGKPGFLVRVRNCENDDALRRRIAQVIMRHGGRATLGAYSFPTHQQREVVMDLLADAFGTRYAERVDPGAEN